VALNVDPTAMQVAVFGHATADNFDPTGMDEVAVQSVKLVVL
jgi:hypothetical protein